MYTFRIHRLECGKRIRCKGSTRLLVEVKPIKKDRIALRSIIISLITSLWMIRNSSKFWTMISWNPSKLIWKRLLKKMQTISTISSGTVHALNVHVGDAAASRIEWKSSTETAWALHITHNSLRRSKQVSPRLWIRPSTNL